MDVIDRIMSLIGGSSGAGIIIATLVGMIKSVWKPKNKKLYWIPASILSVASTVGIFWYVEMLQFSFVNILLILIFSGYTAFYEYVANNEQWAKFKPKIIELLKILAGKKRG